jgi:FkbM family methyltransferase
MSILRKIKAKLASFLCDSRLSPPYKYVQRLTENHLHKLLALKKNQVHHVVIVGAGGANEVARMTEMYEQASFTLFEPLEELYRDIERRFDGHDRVTCVNRAVSNSVGTSIFHETSHKESSSLLKVGNLTERDYGVSTVASHEVPTITLDEWYDQHIDGTGTIDVLWIDVQGAERKVLEGAEHTISNCRAVFLEVSVWEPTYEGGVLMQELTDLLDEAGFDLCQLGTDPLNATGNALYLHPERRGSTRNKISS